MRWPAFTRSLGLYLALIAVSAGVCAWQWGEHRRFKQSAAQALINRGRDITSTLGVVVRSQRRFGLIVSKDRIEAALQDLIRPGELESIVMLGATGETIASAGRSVGLTPEMLRAPGVHWRAAGGLTLMNVMDLGPNTTDEHSRTPPAIVVSDPRVFRPGASRRLPQKSASAEPPAPEATEIPPAATAPGTPEGAPPVTARATFGRPSWMSREEYESVIQKQGVHSLVISLSSAEMQRAVENDFLLRSLVGLLALGGALLSALAWRNQARNAELQIRLVKAGEMNSHLAQMNFAAAGLAHETRNPLNLIRGLAQMIVLQAGETRTLKEHAATIIEEADRVTVQLNEFIDYSKPRQAHLAPVQLSRLVADVARTLLPDLEDKAVRFQGPAAPLAVSADEQLLRQALFNLLLNAVQAVAPGGHIEVRWLATGPGEAALEIADDGPGVPETERANIFKPYVTMRPKGVGLGLAIVQQIVSAHQWEIVCLANDPRGARFRIDHLQIASRHES